MKIHFVTCTLSLFFFNIILRIDTLKKEYDEQKKFYDEALEARTNQLEESENELETFKGEMELAKKIEIDLKAKNESIKFDNEMLNKRIETTTQDKSNASQREEGLLSQLDELSTALKQKESIIEQKVDENFGLKQTIDSFKNENQKSSKRIETLEDICRNKDTEIINMDKEISSCKGEMNALMSKEKGLTREIEGVTNESNSVKSHLLSEKEKNEALMRDLNDMKSQLNQLHQREQQTREAYDKVKSESGVFQQMNQDNLRNLQRDYDNIKTSNMDLKAQLDQANMQANMQAKIQANYAQQVQYQPPPQVQYRPPPQYETYPQYPPPPQFNYNPPAQHEHVYSPTPPSYTGYPEKKQEFETPPKKQIYHPEPRYQSHYSPPHEDLSSSSVSRNHYSEGPVHSQSLVSKFQVYF
jgi:archaellum component FlaC